MDCPKCKKEIADTVVECPHCHVVVAKYAKRQNEKTASGTQPPTPVKRAGVTSPILFIILVIIVGTIFIIFNHSDIIGGEVPIGKGTPSFLKGKIKEPAAPQTTTTTPPPAPQPATDDSNISAKSAEEAEKKVRKLVHGAAPLLPGDPEKQLDH
ncbi:MAG: hypothetical protein HY280_01005 [Nitrospinae bacterium]|nr:hypothetical protein [Nitrospinota bacterium]